MKKKKILLIGPLPLPMGGVSVHVSRLAKKINAANDFECAVFDPGKLVFIKSDGTRSNLFNGFVYFVSSFIVHIHTSGHSRLLVGRISKLFTKKIIFTQHNSRVSIIRFFNHLVKLSDATILVCKIEGVLNNEKIKIIPAFIPETDQPKLDDNLLSLIKPFSKVLLAIATHKDGRPSLYDGKDIYGFDVLLKAYPIIFQKGMVLLLIDVNGTMKKKYEEEILKLNLSGFPIIYLDYSVELIPLLEHTFVLIRPSRTDGDSISIREALNSGTFVIASNVGERPEGTHLFVNESVQSLISVFNDIKSISVAPSIAQEDFSIPVLNLYRSLF